MVLEWKIQGSDGAACSGRRQLGTTCQIADKISEPTAMRGSAAAPARTTGSLSLLKITRVPRRHAGVADGYSRQRSRHSKDNKFSFLHGSATVDAMWKSQAGDCNPKDCTILVQEQDGCISLVRDASSRPFGAATPDPKDEDAATTQAMRASIASVYAYPCRISGSAIYRMSVV